MLWSKSIRHDGKLFSICQCTEYMYAEYGPKAMLRHVTMLDEVGQTVGSSVLKKTSTELLFKSLCFLDNSIYIIFKKCSGYCKLKVLKNSIIF